MNTLRNKVSLIGRLGAKPEIVKFETEEHLHVFQLQPMMGTKTKRASGSTVLSGTTLMHGVKVQNLWVNC